MPVKTKVVCGDVLCKKSNTRPNSATSLGVSEFGDMNREWWQNLDQIMIVAVASLEDLPDQGREAARRWIEKTKLPKSPKRTLLRATKNPKTSIRYFDPRASEEQIAQCQDAMLAELRVRGPAVWAAYRGAPKNGDRLWVTGVPRAEGGLSALYAHIRAEAEFKTKNAAMDAAMDAKQQHRTPVSQPPESSGSDGPETTAAVRDSTGRRSVIDAFISEVTEFAGRKITRKDVWTAGKYKDATEFERFQRSDSRTTAAAIKTFNRILKMNPADFISLLEKMTPKK
jgi:hypothetical protein